MKLFFTILSVMILFTTISLNAQTTLSYKAAFIELKMVMAKRDMYLKKKLKTIQEQQQQFLNSKDSLEKFELSKALFHKYYDLQIDSALTFAEHMLSLSEHSLSYDKSYRQEATLDIALTYVYTGMYKECAELLNKEFATVDKLSDPIRRLYYKVSLELHRGLREHASVEKEIDSNIAKADAAMDSLVSCLPEYSLWHNIYLTNQLKKQGKYDDALRILFDSFNKMSTDDREMAQVAFYISDLYRLKKDKASQKLYLAISATTDFKHAVKEYVSLWKLASILYREGDIDIAYQFIEISLQDATYSGAYRWIQQITKILPRIYEAYNSKIIRQRNAIFLGFTIITVLLGGIVWQYKKLRKNKRQIGRVNEELKSVIKELNSVSENLYVSHSRLEVVNNQLLFLNKELISASLLKETYLTKFIDLCSDYIDKLDGYRINLRRLFKGGNVDLLQKELASKAYIEAEYKAFLVNFDETFLNLYPNFVTEFNSLFPEEEKQEIRRNELLTTELRIYALMRMGITDNSKIARFLKCSITTIYTYRSKIKNKSFCPEIFEETIRDFQKERHFSSTLETV